ncbi:hypothetical protein MKZ38_007262 [Zalerion maritima]|uniref:Heterokaryon incompatibility domain-containing protein n=1 Tax=Zalerion maritima TaxID=339359 RepID=A0AAD5RUX8_9PEZI|nr:hypothetical protein MKZ38_007262 [Zalerion maritima]
MGTCLPNPEAGDAEPFDGLPMFQYGEDDTPLWKDQIRLVRFTSSAGRVNGGKHIPSLTIEAYDLSSTPQNPAADHPYYFALSYTWGPPKVTDPAPYTENDKRPIFLNGKKFDVFPNLYDALLQIEKSFSFPSFPSASTSGDGDDGDDGAQTETAPLFWIDAICINQGADPSAKAEQSKQVGMMDQIYKSASQTIIWLGTCTAVATEDTTTAAGDNHTCTDADTTAKASAFLAKHQLLVRQASLSITRRGGKWQPSLDVSDPRSLALYGIPTVQTSDWIALSDIFSRTYFGRLWVAQEIALSKNPVVLVGDHLLSWDDVAYMGVFLTATGAAMGMAQGTPSPGEWKKEDRAATARGVIKVTWLFVIRVWCSDEVEGEEDKEVRRAIEEFNWGFGTASVDDEQLDKDGKGGRMDWARVFMKLVMATASFDGTDPRDKIFAFYGILRHVLGMATLGEDEGDADEAMKELEGSHFHPDYNKDPAQLFLDVATTVINRTKSMHLVTYAGDTFGGDASPVKGYNLPSWAPGFDPVRPPPLLGSHRKELVQFDASGVSSLSADEFQVDGRELHLSGLKLGTLHRVAEPWSTMVMERGVTEMADVLLTIPTTYRHTGQSRVEALWRTLVMDQDLTSRPASPDLARDFKAWLYILSTKRIQDLIEKGASRHEAIRAHSQLDEISGAEEGEYENKLFPDLELLGAKSRLGERRPVADDPEDGKELREKQEAMLADARRFEMQALYVMLFRRVFATDEGHLGIVSLNAKVGDELWLVKGCPTPVVLSRVDGDVGGGKWVVRYRILGESYVHGIMMGEGISQKPKWEKVCIV